MPSETAPQAPPGAGAGAVAGAAPAAIAFPGEARTLARLLRRHPSDWASLERPVVPRCRLDQCHGMCCYGGVGLSREEKQVIEGLVAAEADRFAALGIHLPAPPIETIPIASLFGIPLARVFKTATRRFPYRTLIPGFPEHFPDTACVFMRDDGRCGLQLVSVQLGRHPWYYKPVSCWLHPLKVGSRPATGLYLPTEATDPARSEGYPGYVLWTHCGRRCPAGRPAVEVFAEEIAFLSAVTGVALISGSRSAARPNDAPAP